MHLPDDQGRPRITQLRLFARRTRRTLPELTPPELPAELQYVWQWFLELHQARAAGPAGPEPIGYAQLDAWARITGRTLRPWEAMSLRRIDALFLRVIAAHRAQTAPPVPTHRDRHRITGR